MMQDRQNRKSALDLLRSWRAQTFTPAAAAAVIRAATYEYPAVAGTYPAVPNEPLVQVLWSHPAAADPSAVEQALGHLPERARLAALRLLAAGSDAAVTVLARVLDAVACGTQEVSARYPVLLPLQQSPHGSDLIVAPLILLIRREEWVTEAGNTLLAFAAAGQLEDAQCSALATYLATAVPGRLTHAGDIIERHGLQARWLDESGYPQVSAVCGLLLDLGSRLGNERLTPVFRQAAGHQDPWIAAWGVLGIARSGAEPPADRVDAAAADPLSRMVILHGLGELGLAGLISDRWRTQLAIAEAVMVRWLALPTELGRAPDAIGHVETFTIDDEGEPADIFLFSFRTDPPHWSADRGAMAGISGPFRRTTPPSAAGGHLTFSRFEPLTSRAPREHLEALAGTVASWQDHHLE